MMLARLIVPARMAAALLAWLCVVNQMRFEAPLAIGLAVALLLVPRGRTSKVPCACFAADDHTRSCRCDCHDVMPARQL